MATSLILYLLNERIIDGAIITRNEQYDPLPGDHYCPALQKRFCKPKAQSIPLHPRWKH